MTWLDSPLALRKTISGRPVAERADDPKCFELAKKWIKTCETRHGDSCRQITGLPLPTRVIDVGPNDGSREPCLKVTKDELGVWAALSHCWGSRARFVTDSENIQDRQKGLSMEDMPKTFSDAVTVTRQLGYQYLWIDSLCIIQGDHQDWVTESMRMGDYYKGAIVTISADSAQGDDAGFLHERTKNSICSLTLSSGEDIELRKAIQCSTFRDRDTYIAKRAWTLQEFVLSTRSLLYTTDQLVFECEARKYCESDEHSQGDNTDAMYEHLKRYFSVPLEGKSRFPRLESFFDPGYRWYSLVNDYSARDMTDRNDIFSAVSGLAREIQIQTTETYAAGIWLGDIHKGLLWRTNGTGKFTEAYHAPSWSWASLCRIAKSLERVIDLYPVHRLTKLDVRGRRASLKTYRLDWTANDRFGRVSFGSIVLHGRSLPANDWRGRTRPHFNSFIDDDKSHYYHHPDIVEGSDQLICYFDVIDRAAAPQDRLKDTVLLQISTWSWSKSYLVSMALLLRPVRPSPSGKPASYRRVGIAEVPNVDGLAEDGWKQGDFCII